MPDEPRPGELEKELNAVPGYAKQFQAVFGTKVTRDGIAKAACCVSADSRYRSVSR